MLVQVLRQTRNRRSSLFAASPTTTNSAFGVILSSNLKLGRKRDLPATFLSCIIHPHNRSLAAMSNVCATRYHKIHLKAINQLSPRRKHGSMSLCRFFSVCPSPQLSANVFPICSRSSLALAADITPFDAPQRSDEWFALRKDKLTTSTFSTALGFWKGNRRPELWHEKVFSTIPGVSQTSAMEWGVRNEAVAIDRYQSITGHDVSLLGFAVHPMEKYDWLGASPDGLLAGFSGDGILEVKCPFNKGKPETALPWSTMPFYYMPQVQGQMEIIDREWVNVYCWTPNGSTIFHVGRDRQYWDIIHGILREFWWENVVPAKEALVLGMEEDAKAYKPASTHRQTGLAIARSIKLASESKLVCREIAGHVEFYR